MNRHPLIIAHRGASKYAPENSLAAFQAAVDAGADGIEFDVQLAADGIPVVIHDMNLKRTAGVNNLVANLTSHQLGRTDIGSWFAPQFSHEAVPTLEQTLQLLSGFNGLIYIELKCKPDNFKPLVAAVCDTIGNSLLLPQIIVKSFCLAAIPNVRNLLPDVQTAALLKPSITTLFRRREFIIRMVREFGADQLSLHYMLATSKLCTLARSADLPVTVWTSNDQKWLELCRKHNIKALITSDPKKLIAARSL